MTTYVKVEAENKLLKRGRVEMETKRLALQEQQEIDDAFKRATPQQNIIPDELLSTTKRQEVAATYQPQLVEATTFVTATGSYSEQTLNLNLSMETYLNTSALKGNTVISTKSKKIYEAVSDLVATGAALGFGESFDSLSCAYRLLGPFGPYFPTAQTEGQWLEYGEPQATPNGAQDLYNIRVQHVWLDVIVYDERRRGLFLGLVFSIDEMLGLDPQPGDWVGVLVEGPYRGYYIYDPFIYGSDIDPSRVFGNWYWFPYDGQPELVRPVLVGPKNPVPSNLLGSSFFGQVKWRLFVITLYEVQDSNASKIRYVSPIPLVIACLAAESRSHKINIVYPDDFVAGYKYFGEYDGIADSPGTRNALSYHIAVFGRQNAGEQWGRTRVKNIARAYFGETLINEENTPSNIYYSLQSIIISNYEVITWKNTPFIPGGTVLPEYQPSSQTGVYNAVIRDPRNS